MDKNLNIAIVSMGRSHLLNLANYLSNSQEINVIFYTMMPKSRCRKFGYKGKVKSFLFPIGILELLIRILPINEYKKDELRMKLRTAFDYFVSLFIKKCNILIGLNGNAVRCSIKAKRKFNSIIICDQGSSHILAQNAARAIYNSIPASEDNTKCLINHYNVADYLMAPSQYVVKTDLENGIPKRKILYNPYGVNLNVFNPGPYTSERESYDVIMVGSWWKHKGCDVLLDICINRLGLKLLHVGGVIDCPIPDSPLFKHVDTVPENDLPNFYNKAKIFVLCSLNEGFAMVLLQAIACGLPTVGSSRTGIKDISMLLEDHPFCIEIPEPLNEENIEKSILKGLSIFESNKNLIIKDKLLKKLSWEAYGERYLQILKTLKENDN